MKFEKLTDTKIRIILSLKDMELNNISVENIISNSADSQKLLESIINKAEKEIGFKPENSELLVEAMALSDKECIFTITKLLDDKKCFHNKHNALIIKFDCFDDFIHMCTFLRNFSYLCLKEISKNFSLIFYNGTYYLKFIQTRNSCLVIDFVKTLFDDFGKDVSHSACIDGLLNEYGKIVFEKNAIVKCLNSFSI